MGLPDESTRMFRSAFYAWAAGAHVNSATRATSRQTAVDFIEASPGEGLTR